MASALQKQLAAIAVSSTHQLDLKAQRSAHGKSLLFEPKVAASQSFESLFLLCYDGFRDLCALDPRFVRFSTTLFSEQSKAEDRSQMTAKENARLDSVLDAFITLAGPRLLLKPAEKALEWLVRRFRVHEHNTECLVFTYLPYHSTPQFLSLLSILPAQPPAALRFLSPYIPAPANPPRRTIAYTAINTPAFFDAFHAHVTRTLHAGHQSPQMLSFWSSITVEAIFGIINASSSGRKDIQDQKTEDLVLRILPVLNSCMRAHHGAEAVTACYTIVIILATQAKLGDKLLDRLMVAVVLARDETSLNECLACLAILAAERTQAEIPEKVNKKLLAIPHLVQKLLFVSKQCQIERLALGCALSALRGLGWSDEKRNVFHQLLDSSLLTEPRTRIVLSALVQLLRDAAPGSEEHGQYLELTSKLAESKQLLSMLQAAAGQDNADLQSLGLTMEYSQETEPTSAADSEDEDMLDVEDGTKAYDFTSQLSGITATSFLDAHNNASYTEIAVAFEQAISSNQVKHFLATEALGHANALQQSRYNSFLARTWCSSRPVPVRVAALRAVATIISHADSALLLQNLLPYLVYALADPSPLVRRATASGIVLLSNKASADSKTPLWGNSDMYDEKTTTIANLTRDDVSAFLSSMIKPILEECVMDPNLIVPAIREMLEAPQAPKNSSKPLLKAAQRTTILSFFASHIKQTPVLRVRLCLLPIFNFTGKASDHVRGSVILPLLRQWCTLPAEDVASMCEMEDITLDQADRGHLGGLVAREAKSIQLLQHILQTGFNQQRAPLIDAVFDRITSLWPTMKSDAKLPLAQAMLELSLKESDGPSDALVREKSLGALREVKLDSVTLVTFLDTLPAAVQMPEGPPAKKRRRTSRNELARVEVTSQHDVQILLRRLTLVLELIESSNPAQYPSLFRPLFSVFGDLQPLKQQSGSELVYLQSIILSCLTPIVNTLREQPNSAEYQSAVRADLLIDCIRHSSSPQVQNSALLLIANLASWVPELILHNLMPIFTFIGSTLLRQHDDYSAQVVDKTISRVVPPLAASLRSKHKNFLTGVSDLLLSFTAAFEHIPLHRRLKLFSELARTLGPEDSLPAIIALLADRYHNSKTQRRFCIDLLLVFDPRHTLDAFKGYLEIVTDAAGPKRKVSDTLFGLNEKQPAQVDSALRNLLTSLADLVADERLRGHVARAFRQKEDSSKSREIFANIVEITIQLSKKVASSSKLYDCCSKVLARCLDLLPTLDLIKSAELLLKNSDPQVQIAAIKAVEIRAGTTAQNDRRSVLTLLSFLPSVEHTLQHSQQTEAKIISVSCIDRIVERFGKKDIAAVTSVARTISGAHSLSNSDDRIRILSLICLTSVVDVLEDEAISLLPTVLPTAFEYLSHAIEEGKTGLHNAVYTLLSNIVERLGYMFSREYLDVGLRLSHRSAEGGLEEACDESRRAFHQSVSEHLGAQEIFAALTSTWRHAVSQGFDASLEHLSLLRATVDNQSKAKLIKASPALFNLFLQAFRLREAIRSESKEEFDDDEIERLDNTLVEAVVAMVLKLNDATFRPFFVQVVDQEGPLSSNPQDAITFYKFLAAFFDKFKSIVTSYSSYLIEPVANTVSHLSRNDTEPELRNAVLIALQKTFQHDQDGFWQSPDHYTTILNPLLTLLSLPSASTSTPDNPTNLAIPTIVDLAAASASSLDNHREMNTLLLRYMRAEEAHTRLATVLCEQALTRRLGEEWLGLLPEMLPFISELREDDDELVERETQRWITGVEEVLGESLEGMLQ